MPAPCSVRIRRGRLSISNWRIRWIVSHRIQLTIPKELGGPGGDGANPEKLFALGYSACFLSAMRVASAQTKIKVPLSAFGKDDQGLVLGITAARFNELVAKAHSSH